MQKGKKTINCIPWPQKRFFREVISIDKNTIKIGSVKYKDTGGGFLLEENPDEPEEPVLTLNRSQ